MPLFTMDHTSRETTADLVHMAIHRRSAHVVPRVRYGVTTRFRDILFAPARKPARQPDVR